LKHTTTPTVKVRKQFIKFKKWMDKPSKLKKWQLLLLAYVIFSLLYIFWPHSGGRTLPSIMLSSVAPVKTLPEPHLATYKPLEMADYPIAQPGTYANDYAFGNCTSLAASMVAVPNSLGNANQWDDKAPIVTTKPVVGMIAQTDAGWAGHVAVVIAVGDGTVTVEEMNYTGFNTIDTRVTPVTDWVYLAWNS
jgi:hypothetical protein